MTGNPPGITGKIEATTLSDRDLLLHILQHVENIDTRFNAIERDIATFKPLLDKWRNSPLGRLGGRGNGWQPTQVR